MSPRPDISEKLVHFTSGANDNEAFDRLWQIIDERRLLGSNRLIRDGSECVCFTEAPLTSLQHGLVNPSAYSRYSPFGIIFDKRWIFERGGRPVIYQPEDEFDLVPDELSWRHMRYEPDAVDFTWEREWRIQCDELPFDANDAGIVVPSQGWASSLIQHHEAIQDYEVLQYSQSMDEILAEQYREIPLGASTG